MEKTKMKVEELCDMKKQLMTALKSQMGNLDNLDTKEAGEVVDMIKDLAEAEAYCWKAKYYETVVEAMKEGEKEPHYGESRMGYDTWRYSNGHYAPTGHGHKSGYIGDKYPHGMWDEPVMGYDMPREHISQTGNMRNTRYGHHAMSPEEKAQDLVYTMKDIWREMTPEHQKKLKADVHKVLMEDWKEA